MGLIFKWIRGGDTLGSNLTAATTAEFDSDENQDRFSFGCSGQKVWSEQLLLAPFRNASKINVSKVDVKF